MIDAWRDIRSSQVPVAKCPEGQYDRSPTPQSLRRDRRRCLRKPVAVGRAVVCEGGLARSAWDSATPESRPVGYGMISIGERTDSMLIAQW